MTDGGFFEAREDSAPLFEAADQTLDDIPTAVTLAVKLGCALNFAIATGDEGLDHCGSQVFANPPSVVV